MPATIAVEMSTTLIVTRKKGMRMVIDFNALLRNISMLQSSQILDDLLSRENAQLEDILDADENAITEFRNRNTKLIEL